MELLDFPIVRQSTPDTCSCACVQACLCYYGLDYRDDEIRKFMDIGNGVKEVHPSKIVEALQHFGKLKAKYKKLTLDNIKVCINRHQPVILNLQAWYKSAKPNLSLDNDGHYAVAVGYDSIDQSSCIIFSDPASFYKTYLSGDELERRWHDGDKADWDYDHMGIIVYGRKPVYKSGVIIKME